MEPSEVQATIDALMENGTSTLESFFNSQGLLAAFKKPDKGWGREKRINEALAEAERQGRREQVLSAAQERFGLQSAPPKHQPTPEDMLESLLHEVGLLQMNDFNEAELLLSRSRMMLEQLFGHGNYVARLNNIHFRESTPRQRLDRVTGKALWDDSYGKLVAVLSTALEHIQLFGLSQGSTPVEVNETSAPVGSRNKRAVMVVHGRDLEVKTAMFTFLRALDLQPIEWSQARMATESGSPYIREILEAAFARAQAFVVLLTPDDVAKLRDNLLRTDDQPYERDLTPQARPNVLFEAGMAMGASAKRTILVQIGYVRPFSDIGGIHILHFSGSTEDRQELAQRLSSAGCDVSITGVDWHTAGEFPRR